MGGLLFQAFIYLCAAVIAVPIAKRLGLGSVLGYLLAGIFIGPVIGLVGSETQTIQHFAEFGVVMMLFLVGLELQPKMLWEMRSRLIGLGGLQVALTTALITAAALMMGLFWTVALTIGLIFSLSSTAIVLQTLNEKGLTKTEGGRAGFSVLLFQDIAVIPMLALIPLLALPELVAGSGESLTTAAESHGDAGHHHDLSLVDGLPGWAHALVVLGAIASVLLGGHFLSRPLFRFIAESRLREIFTASALMLVIGIALLMTLVDLSPALGTFLAGVVLANSEFRHELESDIEPFKGLLLGLFFITVGAGIDFNILFNDSLTILSLTVGVIVIKGLVLYALARAFRLATTDGWLLTLGLAQAGEFGFVLLSFSLQNQVLPAELASTLSLVVALSMLLTPVLFIVYDKLILNRQPDSDQRRADSIDETGSVIIAGNGRFGQIVNRLLVASGVQTTVLDHQADIINMLSKVGVKSYYGDASRPDLLHAAGIESAKAVVIAIDDRSRTLEMVEHIRRHYPEVKILARAFDVNHLYLLNKAGVDIAVRELFDGSLELGKAALRAVGVHPFKVEKMSMAFRKHDENGLNTLYELWDENTEMASNKAYLARAREHGDTLKGMMETDRMQLHDRSERGWTPPPKHYTKDMGE
ncbi:MAG: monovalent cation:proton antiporter-2 (CPA2) family protein [Candidatus Thiodiazotropha weberae]|uniref:monovalent cation:proton antiporter-2 (CPA2) family protein n=1 Tax=Candidatus Thiodiazotropha endoloripes TaxID=1818881 RepID=UPI00083E52F2|nr:monovalent cation:proton antiporter-2 (CPA2) family protein [Candidatus Thiodiazotropha endoloripes]MCG7898382.1 monovalent cation:proton antiporter-2 (CPA2) family protein [Candidatus Thiodiazotropha weberae]MCG7902434.1 monovalent cation:proton antiporter-2 (CPA2) family protein [Candidatus Thiodiazotropha weberae]MCG7912890.1 monovalent cation:proton antiporter-2 (CPA2) family protein [Candidatus Thiodiazotropha weberae]ODB92257.1 potassium transporter [Candidatus Thiodiazotropha endolori